jgi:hypothetical protein
VLSFAKPFINLKGPGHHKTGDGQKDAQVQKAVCLAEPSSREDLQRKINQDQHQPDEGQQAFSMRKEFREAVQEY